MFCRLIRQLRQLSSTLTADEFVDDPVYFCFGVKFMIRMCRWMTFINGRYVGEVEM